MKKKPKPPKKFTGTIPKSKGEHPQDRLARTQAASSATLTKRRSAYARSR